MAPHSSSARSPRKMSAAIVPLSGGRASVLALNFLGDSASTPGNFYQFSLSPEDEARIVARRAVADGRLNGVVLAPNSEWGNRVADRLRR